MRPNARDLHRIRSAVIDASGGRPSLSEFLDRIRGLHPDVDAAAEGIDAGSEGRISEPIGDWGRSLNFGWCSTEGRKHVVEWAYIS